MPDNKAGQEAKQRFDNVAKPVGSLGKFEDLIIKIAEMTGTADVDIKRRAVAVFCSTNGIVEEGVSSSPNEVTRIVADNVANGMSSINAMARVEKADVFMIDMGIGSPTRNFASEPAMTEKELQMAVEKGRLKAHELYEEGYRIIATGEVGMGNTTTATAVICAMLGLEPEKAVGSGAGLDETHMDIKRKVITDAIQKYKLYGASAHKILSCVGGYDIAGMAGMFIGGAECHLPVVIDGVISAAAALAAYRIDKNCIDYMIPSHMSRELSAAAAMKELGLEPVINADMALGEGTGAVLIFGMLDAVLAVYNETATYADLGLV